MGSSSLATSAKCCWLLVHVGVADFEELRERQVDHLVVLQLLREGIGADAEVAVGARQQVSLEPFEIVVERGDDGGVGLRKFCFQRRIVRIGEGGREHRAERS